MKPAARSAKRDARIFSDERASGRKRLRSTNLASRAQMTASKRITMGGIIGTSASKELIVTAGTPCVSCCKRGRGFDSVLGAGVRAQRGRRACSFAHSAARVSTLMRPSQCARDRNKNNFLLDEYTVIIPRTAVLYESITRLYSRATRVPADAQEKHEKP